MTKGTLYYGSISLSKILEEAKKDMETDKIYLGNLKLSEAKEQPLSNADTQDIPNDIDFIF